MSTRKEVLTEVYENLWKLEDKYFDKMLDAIECDHKTLEEEYRHKSDAIAIARAMIDEMR